MKSIYSNDGLDSWSSRGYATQQLDNLMCCCFAGLRVLSRQEFTVYLHMLRPLRLSHEYGSRLTKPILQQERNMLIHTGCALFLIRKAGNFLTLHKMSAVRQRDVNEAGWPVAYCGDDPICFGKLANELLQSGIIRQIEHRTMAAREEHGVVRAHLAFSDSARYQSAVSCA